MEQLFTRIEIGYTGRDKIERLIYNREAFDDDLNIEPDNKHQFLNVGQKITCQGTKYEIESISFVMYAAMEDEGLIDTNGTSQYNCAVRLFVKDA